MRMTQVTGVDKILRNLRLAKVKIGAGLEKGLKEAGLFLQRESQLIVPVQTGNLKNSAFTRKYGEGLRCDVVVGYTARYAAYVHEDLTKAHGKDFNIKHADEISRAGKWSSSLKTQKTTFRAYGKMGTARGGMFPRGENQQAKFLERPARENRGTLLAIIANGALGIT